MKETLSPNTALVLSLLLLSAHYTGYNAPPVFWCVSLRLESGVNELYSVRKRSWGKRGEETMKKKKWFICPL